MKKGFIILVTLFISLSASAQLVQVAANTEPIEGACNKSQIYGLQSAYTGQQEPICPLGVEGIISRLNMEVAFLKQNLGYSDNGMVNLVINCKGEIVSCKMDYKTKNLELDKQIMTVFKTLGQWKAGKLNDMEVDSYKQIGFKIEDSVFSLVN